MTARSPDVSLRLATHGDLSRMVDVDDAASSLYASVGIALQLDARHPFVSAEVERWARSIESSRAYVALDATGAVGGCVTEGVTHGVTENVVGFVTLGHVDDQPYVDQLSVHPRCMRRGIGRALLQRACAVAGSQALWLTTYAHVPWNRPYYARFGFVAVVEDDCGPQLRRILAEQRAVLPDPDRRIAMVRTTRRESARRR